MERRAYFEETVKLLVFLCDFCCPVSIVYNVDEGFLCFLKLVHGYINPAMEPS